MVSLAVRRDDGVMVAAHVQRQSQGGTLHTAESIAFRDLYETHANFVRQAVLRLGGPRGDQDDLVHEVFVVVLRRRDTWPTVREPRAWLYGVTARVVVAARRRTRLRQALGLSAPPPTAGPGPLEAFEQKEASALVYRALEGLSEKKRTVFILHELEGLTGEAIAEIVGCPLKTVWSRLGHARAGFSERLRRLQAGEAR